MNRNKSNHRDKKNTRGMTARRLAATAAMGVGLVAGGAGIASAASSTSTTPATHASSAKMTPKVTDGPDRAGGVISAVSATSITVQDLNGASTTYAIDSATTFNEGPASVPASNLVVGEHVTVLASPSSATTAANINIHLAELAGRVTAMNSNSVTITDPEGFSRTIVESSSTTYTKSGSPSTASAVTVGSLISARGQVDANLASLDASSVDVGPLQGPLDGASGSGGPGFAKLTPMHQ